MFLVSLKSLKGKFILLFAAVAAAVIVCAVLSPQNENGNEDTTKTDTVSLSVSTQDDLLSFISSLGYTAKDEPDSVEEIIIPEEFDKIYEQYNDLQKASGLDLSHYKGCTAKKWTFTITDYPGYEDTDCIRVNLIVYGKRIIGGDICSVELDGFMTGLL